LEEDLVVQLFVRTTRSTRLSRAGQVFKEPRISNGRIISKADL
jgi:hypothetical protein